MTESPIPQEFSMLSAPEKVHAILGAVYEPVSKELVFNFAGVNVDELDEGTKEQIEALFNNDEVVKVESNGLLKYQLSPDAAEKLGKAVDMVSVHTVIANNLLDFWDKGMDLSE
jgi:hypothetical protein